MMKSILVCFLATYFKFCDGFIMAEISTIGKYKRWLNAPDPSTNHNIARKKHHKNTGQWILEDKRYVIWKQQPNSLMWINGIC
jgi:hypothetical protein